MHRKQDAIKRRGTHGCERPRGLTRMPCHGKPFPPLILERERERETLMREKRIDCCLPHAPGPGPGAWTRDRVCPDWGLHALAIGPRIKPAT